MSKQQELLKLFQHPLYSCNVTISIILSVDQNVIQVHNDKDLKLLCKYFVAVSLEAY